MRSSMVTGTCSGEQTGIQSGSCEKIQDQTDVDQSETSTPSPKSDTATKSTKAEFNKKSEDVEDPFELIEEKKSADLSVDGDRILGFERENGVAPQLQNGFSSSLDGEEIGLKLSSSRQPTYDADSYISDGGSDKDDFACNEILSIPSRTRRARSQDSDADIPQIDSEEISLYVEDDVMKRKSTSIHFEQEIDPSNTEAPKSSEIASCEERIYDESPSTKQTKLRINPSPKDNPKYRKGYFGDESPRPSRKTSHGETRGKHQPKADFGVSIKNQKKKQSDGLDIWPVSSASEDELDEDI